MTKETVTAKKKQLAEAISFIEELSWLLESKKNYSSLKSLREYLIDVRNDISHGSFNRPFMVEHATRNYVSPDANKHFLIGVLPRLLQNQNLFPSNKDIAEFAEQVLDILVPRYEKRSKYELIGLVICEINDFDEQRLTTLVRKLNVLLENENIISNIAKEKKDNQYFSWNETIKNISK